MFSESIIMLLLNMKMSMGEQTLLPISFIFVMQPPIKYRFGLRRWKITLTHFRTRYRTGEFTPLGCSHCTSKEEKRSNKDACGLQKIQSADVKRCLPNANRFDETLDALSNAKLFLHYIWQIQIDPGDRERQLLQHPSVGLYELTRLPLGLCNGPATVQHSIARRLGDQNIKTVLIILDSIVVFSQDFESHLTV